MNPRRPRLRLSAGIEATRPASADKAGISGQWLIVGSPDVGDGFELNPAGIFRVQFGGGLRFYF